MTVVEAVPGNITQVVSDALVTTVTSHSAWNGRIDDAIRDVAGTLFHDQLDLQRPLYEGKFFVARTRTPHTGKFGAVFFAVDDLTYPVHQVVSEIVREAGLERLRTLTMPVFRTGAMAGRRQEDPVTGLLRGVAPLIGKPYFVEKVTIVVHDNPTLLAELQSRLRGLEAIANTDFDNIDMTGVKKL